MKLKHIIILLVIVLLSYPMALECFNYDIFLTTFVYLTLFGMGIGVYYHEEWE